MTIRRITVAFVGPDGQQKAKATGSIDRRTDLVRQARAELEAFKSTARRDGDPGADVEYTLSITDAPSSDSWTPKG